MENNDAVWLDSFEQTLEAGLVKICAGEGLIEGELMRTPDIDETWERYIKDYIGDAVVNFNEYPEAAIAWAGFLGMGVAWCWDVNWRQHHKDEYSYYYGVRGWDDMDEHILRDMLGLPLDGPEAKKLSNTMQNCALAALGLLRYESVEAETARGFYALARIYTVMFRIGASIELGRLKYKKVAL